MGRVSLCYSIGAFPIPECGGAVVGPPDGNLVPREIQETAEHGHSILVVVVL